MRPLREVTEVSVSTVPSLIYFKNGEPFVYEGESVSNLAVLVTIAKKFRALVRKVDVPTLPSIKMR